MNFWPIEGGGGEGYFEEIYRVDHNFSIMQLQIVYNYGASKNMGEKFL